MSNTRLIFMWPATTNVNGQKKKILMSYNDYFRFLENGLFGIHYYTVLSSDKL